MVARGPKAGLGALGGVAVKLARAVKAEPVLATSVVMAMVAWVALAVQVALHRAVLKAAREARVVMAELVAMAAWVPMPVSAVRAVVPSPRPAQPESRSALRNLFACLASAFPLSPVRAKRGPTPAVLAVLVTKGPLSYLAGLVVSVVPADRAGTPMAE